MTVMFTEKIIFDALPAAEIKVGELATKLRIRNHKLLLAALLRLKRKGAVSIRKPFLSQERVLKILNEYPNPKCRTISVINLKGGVGKTITTVNLAACLAQLGKKTLIVDLDPQSNATLMMKTQAKPTVYDLLIGDQDGTSAVHKTIYPNLDIIPSEINLAGAEAELMRPEGVSRLRETLDAVRGNYDFILIDCPPSLSLLTMNALVASDSIIVPVQCDQYALPSLDMLDQTRNTTLKVNPDLHIEGILISAFEPTKMLCNEVLALVQQKYGDYIYETIIQRDETLSEAAAKNMPIIHYKSDSSAAQAYMKIAQEVASNGG